MVKKWKLLQSKPVFTSKWLSVLQNAYKLPDGSIVDDYYHLDRPDYVSIIAKNQNDEILIEQQYRRGVDEVLYELPAGWIEQGEEPAEAAKRELLEETGYSGEANLLTILYPNPGFSGMKAYVVMVEIAGDAVNRSAEEDENIKVQLYPMSRLSSMIRKNEIRDMVSVAALQYYLLSVNQE